MSEMATAIGASLALALLLFAILSRAVPSEAAAQIVAGALAAGPLFAEYFKRRRTKEALRSAPVDLFQAVDLKWPTAAAYGVLLVIGIPSIFSFLSAVLEQSALRSLQVTDPVILAAASSSAVIVPVLTSYFFMGRLFARCSNNRWLAVTLVIIIGPLALRAIDFLLLPREYFNRAFPVLEQSFPDFIKLMSYTVPMLAVPLVIGTWWHAKRALRLRVSAMMRLLEPATQETIASLVAEEVRSGRLRSDPRNPARPA